MQHNQPNPNPNTPIQKQYNFAAGGQNNIKILTCTHDVIIGFNNYIDGKSNIVFGSNCKIVGNNNIIIGDGVTHIGDNALINIMTCENREKTLETVIDTINASQRIINNNTNNASNVTPDKNAEDIPSLEKDGEHI